MSRATLGRRATPPDREAGLTLVEVLVVLAVIAIAGSASVLSLAPRRDSAVEGAARQLAAAIQSSADRSLVTGGAVALVLAKSGYRIGTVQTELPPGATLAGTSPTARIAFGGEPFALNLVRGSDRWTIAFDGIETAATPGARP